MKYLSETELAALPIGARVALPNGAGAYPDFSFSGRLEGSISINEPESVWIRLDDHKPDLDEWDNQIQVWLYGGKSAVFDIIETPLDPDNGTLDRFIQVYCAHKGYRLDGDVFGVMFSEADRTWTAAEAARIVEKAAGIYPDLIKA